jgi:hypothetical protein
MNTLRKHCASILAQLALSNTLDSILSQINNAPVHIPKHGDIAKAIQHSNYGLT